MDQKRTQESFSTEREGSEYIIGYNGEISYISEYNKLEGWRHRQRNELTKENVKSAFYTLAKSDVEDFHTLYHLLKENDIEYFQIASGVLEQIRQEYEFMDSTF